MQLKEITQLIMNYQTLQIQQQQMKDYIKQKMIGEKVTILEGILIITGYYLRVFIGESSESTEMEVSG